MNLSFARSYDMINFAVPATAADRGRTMEEPQGHRHFTRVDFRITARAEAGGTVLEGTVENLSLRGMLMATDKNVPVGEHAEITITLADQQAEATETTGAAETHHNEDWPVIEVSGTVVRATAISTAFKFDLIDSDSFIHLKNIVALNSGDPEKTFGEMEAFIEGKPLSL